ncbi:MAG: restriction endonuclease [Verrucomicrobiota bacterium]
MGGYREEGIPSLGTEWTLGFLQCLDWRRYEELCAEVLSAVGYDVRFWPKGMEEGFDLLLRDSLGEKDEVAVRCRPGSTPVRLAEVQSFYIESLGAGMLKAIYMTTAGFTVPVHREYGDEPGFLLVDGWQMLDGIADLGGRASDRLLKFATAGGDWFVPSCERCGAKMRLRRPMAASVLDEPFWACPNFARMGCRETLSLPEGGPLRALVMGIYEEGQGRGGGLEF